MFTQYLIREFQPILVFVFGLIILIFVGYTNWHSTAKSTFTNFILDRVYKHDQRNLIMAEGLFSTLTAYLLAIGLISIIISLVYLTNGAF